MFQSPVKPASPLAQNSYDGRLCYRQATIHELRPTCRYLKCETVVETVGWFRRGVLDRGVLSDGTGRARFGSRADFVDRAVASVGRALTRYAECDSTDGSAGRRLC